LFLAFLRCFVTNSCANDFFRIGTGLCIQFSLTLGRFRILIRFIFRLCGALLAQGFGSQNNVLIRFLNILSKATFFLNLAKVQRHSWHSRVKAWLVRQCLSDLPDPSFGVFFFEGLIAPAQNQSDRGFAANYVRAPAQLSAATRLLCVRPQMANGRRPGVFEPSF
jgi:hypothetical protein